MRHLPTQMQRRTFLAISTSGFLGLGFVKKVHAQHYEALVMHGSTKKDGVTVSCSDTRTVISTGREAFTCYSSSDGKTYLSRDDKPSVGFGNREGKYRVRARAAGGMSLSLSFPGKSKHGGFRGKYDVHIELEEGDVDVISTSSGPIVLFKDAVGSVSSGSCVIAVAERSITNRETNAHTGGRRGCTPLTVVPKGAVHEYRFESNGRIVKRANRTFKRY